MKSTQNASSKSGVTKRATKVEPLSPAAARIVQCALNTDVELSALAEMAQSDPAFTLRILSYVNNPVLGLGRRVTSVQHAATLLGIRGLRSLALSLVITHLAPETNGTEVLLANCLRRAIAAQNIARKIGFLDTESAFTLGLFLDVGLLVFAKDDPKSAIAIANSPACFRLVRERAEGFRMHPDVGASVALDHYLSEEFVEAILRHHGLTCPTTPLARIAWVAERIAAVFEGSYYPNARNTAEEALACVELGSNDLESMLETIPQTVVELSTVFDRYVGPQLEIEALRARAEECLLALTEQYESLVGSLESLVRTKERLEAELRDASSRIEELATTDTMTGLYNRRALRAALERDLARADRDATDLAILLIDIDHFKAVNDTWGPTIGDTILALVSRIILGTLRSGDVAGRYDGGKFLVVLPSTEINGARVVAERIRSTLSHHAVAGPKGPISVTCSVGLAHERGPGCRLAHDPLMSRATQALYAAKSEGRDRVTCAN